MGWGLGKPGHVWVQTVVVRAEGPSSALEGDRGVEWGVKEDCAGPGGPGGGAQGPCLVLLVEGPPLDTETHGSRAGLSSVFTSWRLLLHPLCR